MPTTQQTELIEWSKDAVHVLEQFLAYAETMRGVGMGCCPTGLLGHSAEAVTHGLRAAIVEAAR